MKAKQPLCPNTGFTVIESMLALVILAIGLLALAALQVNALRGNALSRRMATAVSIAEQRTEQLKNTPFANIQAETISQVTASILNFTMEVTVAHGPLPNTKTVSVIVRWQDKWKTHMVPIVTVIGN